MCNLPGGTLEQLLLTTGFQLNSESLELTSLTTIIGMLKITVCVEGNITKLVLEGRLCGPWVQELERCARDIRKDRCNVLMVDLTGTTFIDPNGERLLTRLWRKGWTLHSRAYFSKSIIEGLINAKDPG